MEIIDLEEWSVGELEEEEFVLFLSNHFTPSFFFLALAKFFQNTTPPLSVIFEKIKVILLCFSNFSVEISCEVARNIQTMSSQESSHEYLSKFILWI